MDTEIKQVIDLDQNLPVRTHPAGFCFTFAPSKKKKVKR